MQKRASNDGDQNGDWLCPGVRSAGLGEKTATQTPANAAG